MKSALKYDMQLNRLQAELKMVVLLHHFIFSSSYHLYIIIHLEVNGLFRRKPIKGLVLLPSSDKLTNYIFTPRGRKDTKWRCVIVNAHYQDLIPLSALYFTCTCTQKYTDLLSDHRWCIG